MNKKQMIQDKVVYLLNDKSTQDCGYYNLIDQQSNQIPEHLRFLVDEINDSFIELQRFSRDKDDLREKGQTYAKRMEFDLASFVRFYEEIHDRGNEKLSFDIIELLAKEDKRIQKEQEEMKETKRTLEECFEESLDRYCAYLKRLVDITEFFLDHYEIPDFFEVPEDEVA